MSKERVIVLSVVQQHLTKAEAARRYEVSWRWVHTLVTRYQACGWEAVEPRSRRPHSNSRAVSDELRQRICLLRCELQAAGLDNGPVSIAARLQQEGLRPPAFSTIRRILTVPASIPRHRRNGQKAPIDGSKPTSQTSAGNPTSPTGS